MIFRRNRAKGGKFIALTFLYFFLKLTLNVLPLQA